MLSSHINAIEDVLAAQSAIASNAGHPNLRGGPREWFVRSFLNDHLPRNLEIGQGEIIDRDSEPGPPKTEYRNQEDIVIYRKDFPRISFSPNDFAFLAEGVVATLEVKSIIDEEKLGTACAAAMNCKNLERAEPVKIFGDPPGNIFCYVIAFDGPANMRTVAGWLPGIVEQLGVSFDKIVDMIVIIGKGIVWHREAFANAIPVLAKEEGPRWILLDQRNGNLLWLFTHMLSWMPYMIAPPSFLDYTKAHEYEPLFSNYQTVE